MEIEYNEEVYIRDYNETSCYHCDATDFCDDFMDEVEEQCPYIPEDDFCSGCIWKKKNEYLSGDLT